MNKTWYHGTTASKYTQIKKCGFKEGTWFSRHMESAQKYGGSIVIKVNVIFDVSDSEWQVCSSNALPVSVIREVFHITKMVEADHDGE